MGPRFFAFLGMEARALAANSQMGVPAAAGTGEGFKAVEHKAGESQGGDCSGAGCKGWRVGNSFVVASELAASLGWWRFSEFTGAAPPRVKRVKSIG
jgi:hypothetical protein